ncbi:MAG: hypothetical protein ACI9G9_001242 [Psychromonas sp.]|jgi:hypothetical protein
MMTYLKALTLFFVFILFSCSQKLHILDQAKVKRMKTSELLTNIDSLTNQKISYFYSKISTRFNDTTRSVSFKTSLRMSIDTAFNAIITYAKIPIINTLVTPDSLKVVNKRDKCLMQTDLEYIKEDFGVDFAFSNLEELMLGLPMDYDSTQKYFQIHEPYRYVISSHRKRRARRIDKKEKEYENVLIKYFISKSGNQLEGMEIVSPSDSACVIVKYISRQMVDNISIPEEINIEVFTPRNHLKINFFYDKVRINEVEPLYFIVPDGYEECE